MPNRIASTPGLPAATSGATEPRPVPQTLSRTPSEPPPQAAGASSPASSTLCACAPPQPCRPAPSTMRSERPHHPVSSRAMANAPDAPGLSSEFRALLHRYNARMNTELPSSDTPSVRVLRRPISHGGQLLVLVGETHYGPADLAKMHQDILRHVSHVAVEGVYSDPDQDKNHICGKLYGKFLQCLLAKQSKPADPRWHPQGILQATEPQTQGMCTQGPDRPPPVVTPLENTTDLFQLLMPLGACILCLPFMCFCMDRCCNIVGMGTEDFGIFRNRTMAKNIDNFFHSDSNPPILLAIMGAAHLGYIARRLQKNFHYVSEEW